MAGGGHLHSTGAGRPGARRGQEPDTADRDGRAGGPAVRRTGTCRRGRAHLGDRIREHEHAWQRGARHRVRRLRRRVRLEAAGRATGSSVRVMSEDPFVAHRSLLFTVAYEMLGSVADAEDVVQENWLRWAALAGAERREVRDPRACLVRIVTRLSLNRLRTLARRREEYTGQWLPE